MSPAVHIDAEYTELFLQAHTAGVEIYVDKSKFNDDSILITTPCY